ncbi:MAG: dipeptidyl-peptidase 3 family protein [Myxococcota bacterium]
MLAMLALSALATTPAPDGFLKERFGNHAIAQLHAEGAAKLSTADKRVAWYLTLAAHAGEPIQYDQLGWNLVAAKRLLENVYVFGRSESPSFDQKLADYLKRFYGHLGNHDHVTGQKFVPGFSFDELAKAAQRAFQAGAPMGVKDEAALAAHLSELRPTLFDAAFEPLLTAKSPPAGQDIVTASANTCYGKGVTLKDLESFPEKNALNSRVVKVDGALGEQVFRAGTPDKKVPPGLYAEELGRVIAHLGEAAKHAKKDQRAALRKLVRYFQTGNLKDWDAFNIAWLEADPVVDANVGFIESYVDARGQKGQWEALVNYKDVAENQVMELIGAKVQYFEDKLPWPDVYKRKKVKKPVAKAINLVTAYPSPPAGINLPNEQHIREKYGSKSVMVSNTMEAAAAIKRLPLALEFAPTPEDKAHAQKYSTTARKWLVAFHEVAGHASGQVDKKLKGDPSKYLQEFDNTLEEARADLVALWHAFDPALKVLHPEAEEVAKQMYRDFLVEGVTNLHRVESGSSFEEDHQRGHWMTVSYLAEKGGARWLTEGGKTYLVPTEYPKMRAVVGELLSKLMVIKATGDYAGIKALVEEKGIRFDPKLRDEVAARVKAANVPTVTLMASPQLVPVLDKKGSLADVRMEHEQDFIEQHLERSLLGELSPAEATRLAAEMNGTSEGLWKALRGRAIVREGGASPETKKTAP